jgi:hypothetical protein
MSPQVVENVMRLCLSRHLGLALLLSLTIRSNCMGDGAMTAPIVHWDADLVSGKRVPGDGGQGRVGTLHTITCDVSTETLGVPSAFRFNGADSFISTADHPDLNASEFSISLWFSPAAGSAGTQKPLVVKSAPAHRSPWYQYGLFVLDRPGAPGSISFGIALDGTFHQVTALNAFEYDTWTHATAVREPRALVLYVNGLEAARNALPAGDGERFGRPLLCGAYENLPHSSTYCYAGGMADVRLYNRAVDAEEATALFDELSGRFGARRGAASSRVVSDYERGLNQALDSGDDAWGERLLQRGDASYEAVEPLLRPLFYSTGRTNREYGPHSLLFAMDGGVPPYIVPLADGSRVYAGTCTSDTWVQVEVGTDAGDVFGRDLSRLGGPTLEDGYRLVLQTRYTTAAGVRYVQECSGGFVPGISHPVALMRVALDRAGATMDSSPVRFRVNSLGADRVSVGKGGRREGDCVIFALTDAAPAAHLIWSPGDALPTTLVADSEAYGQAKTRWVAYWDEILSRGMHFELPEPRVMKAIRNLLMQNLMLRWRYSLGSAVYHNSFYQPESSDSVQILGMYGYPDAFREGLQSLLTMTKGQGQYVNWEIAEKLSHGAAYYHFTGDKDFIRRNTPAYVEYIRQLAAQNAKDPHGLLEPQRMCGDQDYRAYATFHIMTCWRGIRDLRVIWSDLGDDEAVAACGDLDRTLRASLRKAVDACSTRLDDGSLFVPNRLYADLPVFDPITATRDGSYWNLCMPYAFSSGFWDPAGDEMQRILRFVHHHGGTFLGLLRFNYYPVPVGRYRADGLPGYATTGVDNVYLPNYLRAVADQDDADRLILSFYGMLAHGMTRDTYMSGEGDTLGVQPPYEFRSSYGSACSANNSAKLLGLRLLLLRETFARDSGRPQDLHLAPALPRAWLEDGRRVAVTDAPTCFGTVSYSLDSALAEGELRFRVSPPQRLRPQRLTLRVRLPEEYRIEAATLAGRPFDRFDAQNGVLDLSGTAEAVEGVLKVARR